MRVFMFIIGVILIIIPDPATTGAGLIMVLASFGLKGGQNGKK